MSRVKLLSILAVALVAICMAPAARAVVYDLTVDKCSVGTGCIGLTGGTVTVLPGATSSQVDITVSLVSGVEFQWNPDTSNNNQATFVFNADISSLTISNLTTGWVPQSGIPSFGFRTDGLGTFDYAIACPNPTCQSGQTTNPSSVSFTMTNGSGLLSPINFNVLSTGGDPSVYFAADVIGNGTSGYIGAPGPGAPDVVPEPTSIAFFGTGLLGVGLVLRRKFANKA